LISVTAWAVGAAAAGPDLVPTSLVAPGSASAQQAISVTWTVQNQGSASAVGSWQDGLYLSATPTCCSGATALGAWPRGGPLAARASYTQVKNASVPDVPAGNYYLVVWADAGGVLGEDRDDNNQRAIPIRITAPDLTPTALTAPAAAPAGQPVSVSWTVKNQGTGATVGAWSDDLLLSATPTCCSGAISLMRTPHTALSAGAAYSQTRSVTLPRVAPGSYYLIVRADAAGVLHEADETNNERAIPITVTAPDLTPTALTVPGAAAAGHAISLSWTVQNRGTGPAVGSWTDKIYLSASQTCCSGASSLGAWVHASALGSGGSYTETRSVTIPNVAPGTYYVTVWTDASGQLSEAADGNNQLATPIAVTGGSTPPSTLAISSVNAGRHPVAGTSFAVIVQARDVAGAPRAVSSPTGVTLALKAGDGALGGTVAGTIPAGASQITIGGVTYTRAQSGVALTANRTSGDALTPGDSSPFTVDPGSTASYAVAVASAEPVGVTFAVSVTARDAFGNTVTTDSSTLVTLRSDSGHVAFDGNADGAFGDGSRRLATGAFTVNARSTVAESTTITASDARGKMGSAPLALVAGTEAALAFVTQPGSASVGAVIAGPPTVAVRDAFGNTVLSSTTAITVTLAANPGGGSLGGTATRIATSGVAAFSDLTVDRPGTGYTLTATAAGLPAATSSAFTISSITAGISGRISRASDGQPVPGAVIDALQGSLVKASTTAATDGTYAIGGLAPGVYAVRASAAGYQPGIRQGVTLNAGGSATVNLSLVAAPGAVIHITSPVAGSVADQLVILVQGDVGGVTGADVGVNVNDMPGFLDGAGHFLALVPVSPAITALTAKLSGFAGLLAADSVPITVSPSAADSPVSLRATPAGGLAPLAVTFDLTSRVGVAQVALDANGDGVADYQAATLSGVSFTFSQPGAYAARATVTDLAGRIHTAAAIVEVSNRAALDQRLQAIWQGLKDALRAGDVPRAASFIHSAIRDQYRTQFSQLNPATLANVDQIMTPISLVEVGFAGAQYEMLRVSDGQTFSYAVWFQLDTDGLWRLRRF